MPCPGLTLKTGSDRTRSSASCKSLPLLASSLSLVTVTLMPYHDGTLPATIAHTSSIRRTRHSGTWWWGVTLSRLHTLYKVDLGFRASPSDQGQLQGSDRRITAREGDRKHGREGGGGRGDDMRRPHGGLVQLVVSHMCKSGVTNCHIHSL